MNTNEIEFEKFIETQKILRNEFVTSNQISIECIDLVAGVDLAYWVDHGTEYAVCCIVTIDYKSREIIEKVDSVGKVEYPYIPGFLAFREIPLILETNKKQKIHPDIFMFDGNGYLHSRHMGIATHAGILLKKPSIGVAKSYFKIDNIDYKIPDEAAFSYTDIVIHNDVYGRAFRSHKNGKPIFISIGNMIDLDTATNVVKTLVTEDSRIPLPIKLADAETRRIRKIELMD